MEQCLSRHAVLNTPGIPSTSVLRKAYLPRVVSTDYLYAMDKSFQSADAMSRDNSCCTDVTLDQEDTASCPPPSKRRHISLTLSTLPNPTSSSLLSEPSLNSDLTFPSGNRGAGYTLDDGYARDVGFGASGGCGENGNGSTPSAKRSLVAASCPDAPRKQHRSAHLPSTSLKKLLRPLNFSTL